MANVWNDYMLEQLLEYVEGYPSLWDKSNKTYKRNDINNKIWNDLGGIFGFPGEEVQRQFNLLKRRYQRHREKIEKETRSGASSANRSRPFYLAEKMEFLNVSFKRRRTEDSLIGVAGEPWLEPMTQPDEPPQSTEKRSHTSVVIEKGHSPSVFVQRTAESPNSSDNTRNNTAFTESHQLSEEDSIPLQTSRKRTTSCNSSASETSSRPPQASRMKQQAYAESRSAFVAITEVASAIKEKVMKQSHLTSSPPTKESVYQEKFVDFMKFALGTLPEEKQKTFMDSVLEVYSNLSKNN